VTNVDPARIENATPLLFQAFRVGENLPINAEYPGFTIIDDVSVGWLHGTFPCKRCPLLLVPGIQVPLIEQQQVVSTPNHGFLLYILIKVSFDFMLSLQTNCVQYFNLITPMLFRYRNSYGIKAPSLFRCRR
jgi:hypothetical protein